jgi:hypothetical protein
MYFLWKREKRRKEKKNDHQRQTTHHPPSRATLEEIGCGGAFKDTTKSQI